jgi:hypothetical protein
MPRAYWRLKYAREATAKLYELREAGFAIHQAIKALQFERDPFAGAIPVGERDGWFEFESFGCWVGVERSSDPEDIEPTLRILYVVEIAL